MLGASTKGERSLKEKSQSPNDLCLKQVFKKPIGRPHLAARLWIASVEVPEIGLKCSYVNRLPVTVPTVHTPRVVTRAVHRSPVTSTAR